MTTPLYLALPRAGLAASSSAARRCIMQGGVTVNGKRETDPTVAVREGARLTCGRAVAVLGSTSEATMTDDQILREMLRYPHDEIRAWEKANPDLAKPVAPPEPQTYPSGTRVRVIGRPRPPVSVGVVMAERWGEAGGCLVRHDDSEVYGWGWAELEPE